MILEPATRVGTDAGGAKDGCVLSPKSVLF